jgi:hypothetical protein
MTPSNLRLLSIFSFSVFSLLPLLMLASGKWGFYVVGMFYCLEFFVIGCFQVVKVFLSFVSGRGKGAKFIFFVFIAILPFFFYFVFVAIDAALLR